MKITQPAVVWTGLLLVFATVAVQAALVAGGVAYTKRIETKLLAEPKPLATVSGKVGYAKSLKVEEVSGAWLRVSEGASSGWVFSGNITDVKPAESTGSGLGLTASDTNATAAARPLTPAGKEYSTRRNLRNPSQDLEWLLDQTYAITDEDVDKFLQEHKKGEYK